MDTPVLFLIFNRPEVTATTFESIKLQKPSKLYIAADGYRKEKDGEKEKCEITREKVLSSINWHCELKTLFRDENLGCGRAVSEAITWFFNQEEQGIILEDDCTPSTSFFNFCSTLLNKYADEKKIMMITGCSFQKNALDNYSYYYSNYMHVWGWATWRRAWEKYDYSIPDFNDTAANVILKKKFSLKRERKSWISNIRHAANETINTWDYQWMYAIWKNDGLSVVPWKNMVTNVGYGEDATHTTGFNANTMALPSYELSHINHPQKIEANKKADNYIRYKFIIGKINLLFLLKKELVKLIKRK